MDRVKQKLSDWQQHLNPRHTLLKKIFSAPLVILSLFFAAGIIFQNYNHFSLIIWMLILTGSVLTGLHLYFSKQRYQITIMFIAISFLALGAIRFVNYKTIPAHHIKHIVQKPDTIATLKGRIVSKPRIHSNDEWLFRRYRFYDPMTSFYLQIESILTGGGFKPATGFIKTYISQPVLDLKPGSKIKLLARLNTYSQPRNPGQFNVKKYMESKNVYLTASVRSAKNIKILQRDPPVILKVKNFIRSRLSIALLSHNEDDRTSSMLNALLLGNRREISSQTTHAFRKTGLLHFISLSGLHIGILLTFTWFALNPVISNRQIKAGICIFIVLLFLLAVPPRAPTVRACIIALFFFTAVIFQRKPAPFNSLALAFITLLMIRPTEIYSAGFQLSFACVTGILLFTKQIDTFINSVIKFQFIRFLKKPITLLSTGIAAWLGGAGVLLYHFHTVNFLAPVWTVLAFPFISVILAGGLLKIITAPLFPTLSVALAGLLKFITIILINLVSFLSQTLPGQINTGKIPFAVIFLYYLVIFIFIHRYFLDYRTRKILVPALISILLATLSFNIFKNKSHDKLTLSVLDVGPGQCIVLQTADENFIFDGGSLTRSDTGNSTINPFLNYKGITNIDALFISHDDIDHYNGLAEVIKTKAVEKIFINKAFKDKKPRSSSAKLLLKFLDNKNLEPEILNPGKIPLNPLDARVLWPEDFNPLLSDNDLSSVYLLSYQNKKILICSDIEKDIQRKLLRKYPDLSADILIMPHHGSSKSISDDFINTLNPKIAVASCSKRQLNNTVNLPDIPTYFTAKHGCITVNIDENSKISASPFIKNQ